MEVSISTERAGLSAGLTKDIKRLSPRALIPHNVERALALRIRTDSDPLLDEGDLVIHRDSEDAVSDNLCVVLKADRSTGRVDLEDQEGERFECVPFTGDLIVFDLAPADGESQQSEEEVEAS